MESNLLCSIHNYYQYSSHKRTTMFMYKSFNNSGSGSSGIDSGDPMWTSGSANPANSSTNTIDSNADDPLISSLDLDARNETLRMFNYWLDTLQHQLQTFAENIVTDSALTPSSRQLKNSQVVITFAQSCLGFAHHMHSRRPDKDPVSNLLSIRKLELFI